MESGRKTPPFLRARLVVRGFSNLDNHKTRVAASNRNNRKLPLWGMFKLQEVCLVAKKINSKKVTQKNQNNYYETNIGTCILIIIFFIFFILKIDGCCGSLWLVHTVLK